MADGRFFSTTKRGARDDLLATIRAAPACDAQLTPAARPPARARAGEIHEFKQDLN